MCTRRSELQGGIEWKRSGLAPENHGNIPKLCIYVSPTIVGVLCIIIIFPIEMAGTGRTNQNVLTIFFQLCHIATFHSRLGKIRKIYWTLTSGVPCFSHGLIQVPDRSGKATWRPTAIGFVMWQRMRWVQQLVSLRFSEFPWGHISTGNSSLELIFATCLSLTQNYTLVYTSINCESKCHFKSWPSCSWHLPVWYLLTRFSLQINIQMSAATISLQSQNLKNLSNLQILQFEIGIVPRAEPPCATWLLDLRTIIRYQKQYGRFWCRSWRCCGGPPPTKCQWTWWSSWSCGPGQIAASMTNHGTLKSCCKPRTEVSDRGLWWRLWGAWLKKNERAETARLQAVIIGLLGQSFHQAFDDMKRPCDTESDWVI